MAERVRALRIAKGLTQKALAKKVGVSDAAVVGWERGKNRPSPANMEPLCKELGASEAQLDGKEPLNKSTQLLLDADFPALRSALEASDTEIQKTLSIMDRIASTGDEPKTKPKPKKKKTPKA